MPGLEDLDPQQEKTLRCWAESLSGHLAADDLEWKLLKYDRRLSVYKREPVRGLRGGPYTLKGVAEVTAPVAETLAALQSRDELSLSTLIQLVFPAVFADGAVLFHRGYGPGEQQNALSIVQYELAGRSFLSSETPVTLLEYCKVLSPPRACASGSARGCALAPAFSHTNPSSSSSSSRSSSSSSSCCCSRSSHPPAAVKVMESLTSDGWSGQATTGQGDGSAADGDGDGHTAAFTLSRCGFVLRRLRRPRRHPQQQRQKQKQKQKQQQYQKQKQKGTAGANEGFAVASVKEEVEEDEEEEHTLVELVGSVDLRGLPRARQESFKRRLHQLVESAGRVQSAVEALSLGQRVAAASQWVPDDLRPSCVVCFRRFGQLRRKHHCRICGEVVCNACSNFRTLALPHRGPSNLRICQQCNPDMAAHLEAAERGTGRKGRRGRTRERRNSLPTDYSSDSSAQSRGQARPDGPDGVGVPAESRRKGRSSRSSAEEGRRLNAERKSDVGLAMYSHHAQGGAAGGRDRVRGLRGGREGGRGAGEEEEREEAERGGGPGGSGGPGGPAGERSRGKDGSSTTETSSFSAAAGALVAPSSSSSSNDLCATLCDLAADTLQCSFAAVYIASADRVWFRGGAAAGLADEPQLAAIAKPFLQRTSRAAGPTIIYDALKSLEEEGGGTGGKGGGDGEGGLRAGADDDSSGGGGVGSVEESEAGADANATSTPREPCSAQGTKAIAQPPLSVRFVAGTALRDKRGRALGSVCAMDRSPRDPLDRRQLRLMQHLSSLATMSLEGKFGSAKEPETIKRPGETRERTNSHGSNSSSSGFNHSNYHLYYNNNDGDYNKNNNYYYNTSAGPGVFDRTSRTSRASSGSTTGGEVSIISSSSSSSSGRGSLGGKERLRSMLSDLLSQSAETQQQVATLATSMYAAHGGRTVSTA